MHPHLNLYFISGLGVDRRAFQRLEVPSCCTVHHIAWIRPLPGEPIGAYARRLSAAIDPSQPFVLIGMSFGGMMAVELNRFVQPRQTILISSAATKNHLPPYFRLAGRLGLHKLVPPGLFRRPNGMFHWLFGVHTPEEKKLFKDLIADADLPTVRWSVNAVVNWENTQVPPNLVHISGAADRLLPPHWARPDIAVAGGGHLMVFSKAKEISRIMAEIIKGL
ncbi:alpha/beta hydrolase [Paraflavisolibacter sp. H34]|uniref:alpha/beta fold hydrolase n=1 Tax=Huijunlia imazamoxiresistens TaxID=3127457 RepID=UPI0030198217